MDQELILVDELKHTLRYYWLIALVAILGGAVGFAFRYITPPSYESRASLHVMVDFTNTLLNKPESAAARIYDEDQSMQSIQAAFVETMPQVISYAQSLNLPQNQSTFSNNFSIDRMLAFWDIRFRYKDPVIAQKIVSYWVKQSLALLDTEKKSGVLKPYISYELVSNASLPAQPAYYQTNLLVLAGAVIGLIVGVLIVRIPGLLPLK